MAGTLWITGDEAADALLNEDGTALVVGMLLDQQVPMAWAFRGPASLRARLGHLDPRRLAAMDEDDLVAVFVAKPALHRYPAVMARRTHALCVHVVEAYGGNTACVWTGAANAAEQFARVRALPGFGEEKAQIFTALLAKRMGVAPLGWRAYAGVFADDETRSVADCHDASSLARVRAWKRSMREAGRDKQGQPLR